MSLAKSYLLVKVLQTTAKSWTLTTYVLFVLSFDYNLWHVNMLNVVFMATIFLIDPLTGAIGDKYGYKRIYIVGALLWGVGELVYGLGSHILIFAVAEFIAALGYAAESEALESLIDNQLPSNMAAKLRAQAESLAYVFGIAGAVLGGFVGNYFGLNVPWLIGGVFNLLLALIAWKAIPEIEAGSHVAAVDTESFVTKLTQGAKITRDVSALRNMAIVTFVTVACFQPLNMFWTAHLAGMSGEGWWLGFVWIGIALMMGGGAYLTQNATSENVRWRHFGYLLLAIAIPVALASVGNDVFVVASLFVLHELPRGAWRNMAYAYVNKSIPSNKKSTINSFRSAIGTGGAAAGLIISGWLATFMSVSQVWSVSAICLALLAVWVVFFLRVK